MAGCPIPRAEVIPAKTMPDGWQPMPAFAGGLGAASAAARLFSASFTAIDRQLVEQDGRQRERDLADRVGRGEHGGDDEHADDGVAAIRFSPSAVTSPRGRAA